MNERQREQKRKREDKEGMGRCTVGARRRSAEGYMKPP